MIPNPSRSMKTVTKTMMSGEQLHDDYSCSRFA